MRGRRQATIRDGSSGRGRPLIRQSGEGDAERHRPCPAPADPGVPGRCFPLEAVRSSRPYGQDHVGGAYGPTDRSDATHSPRAVAPRGRTGGGIGRRRLLMGPRDLADPTAALALSGGPGGPPAPWIRATGNGNSDQAGRGVQVTGRPRRGLFRVTRFQIVKVERSYKILPMR